mgnify:CR=1 FL=1
MFSFHILCIRIHVSRSTRPAGTLIIPMDTTYLDWAATAPPMNDIVAEATAIASACDFKVFRSAADSGGTVRAINAKGCGSFTRKQLDDLTEFAIQFGAKGLAWVKVTEHAGWKPRDSAGELVFGGGLADAGVGDGDRVAILCANNRYFVISYLAVIGLGAVAVPLNPTSPGPELESELATVEPVAAIVGPAVRTTRQNST